MTSRPAQRNPDRTRRRILQAAISLFAQQGFHAVSVDQIVGRARVNKRMVYHYFGSKDALFEAALAEVLALRLAASLASPAQTCVAVTEASRQQTANQALRNFIIIPRVASRDPTSSTVRQPAQA